MSSPIGAFNRAFRVDLPRPLSAAQPERHADEFIPVTRDDAPPTTGITPPTSIVDHSQFWSTVDGDPKDEIYGARTHERQGGHTDGSTRSHGRAPENTEDTTRVDFGGYVEATLKGAAGAAHAGLRAEGSAPWMNPGDPARHIPPGFSNGLDYQPYQSNRIMGTGRMRSVLRPYSPNTIEDGSAASPASGRGRNTSPFDRAMESIGGGPDRLRQRSFLPPIGDQITVETGASDIVGGDFAL